MTTLRGYQRVGRLPYLQACLFATILEDLIPQLRILDASNTSLRIDKTILELDVLLANKFDVKISNEYKTEDINLKTLGSVKNILDKLQADRLRRDLYKQLRQLRNHIKSVCYEKNNEIQLLRANVDDGELNAGARDRYVEDWQRSRTEQHLLTMYDKEIVPAQLIQQFKQRIEQEQHVHTEIELLTNININIMEHEKFTKNWIDFKNEREANCQYLEKMTKSAITVQAWWRGLLVRNQLGPYKPTKKKAVSAKSNEKPKKKK
ncbi:dynein regulatory complex protein 9-like [Bicyclus anynana]|uniref:Dynein regulatory complex protein 9 n=1 Tax=Bicyclus anynana TaxID=110368 RepID=A0ABM3LYK5_BICAN|nr:dynein regulatory complex protein 9-like [Bicyclus anynana]